MCGVCGCGSGEKKLDGKALDEAHSHDHGHDHAHDHTHDHHHHDHDHDHTHSHTHSHAPELDGARMVQIEMDIMSKNDGYARQNRERFAQAGQLALNLVSSPGSGKTSLLVRTLEDLKTNVPMAVIEGDQETANDAERIRATGAPAIQLNTGRGCHLDAHMIGHALDELPDTKGGVLFIENVGNLVCPAGFDLGEAHKVVVLSVTEGEDKPLKYPDMFAASDVMILNKIDLLPHLDYDVDLAIANARQINPRIRVLKVSARTGEGMDNWYAFLEAARTMASLDHATMAAE